MRRWGRPSVISVCFYSACPKLEKSQCWGCQGWHPTQVSPLGYRASLLSHWCLPYQLWVCRGFSDHLAFWDTFPGEIAQSPIPLRRVSCPKLLLAPCVCCQQDLRCCCLRTCPACCSHTVPRGSLSWLILPLHSVCAPAWALPLVRGPRIKQDHTPPRLETVFWKYPFPEGFKSNSG